MVVFLFLFSFLVISVLLIGIVKAGRRRRRMKGGRRKEKKRKEEKKKKGARCGDEDEIKGRARCS